MAHKVIMPKQGLQMTEGTITKWLAQEGDSVQEGQPLFEMETDKLTIEMDAPASGTLLKIIEPEGKTVPITELIAVIGDSGEDVSAIVSEAAASASAPAAAAPAASAPAAAPAQSAAPAAKREPGKFSTPRARWRAEEAGINISDVPASGPDGLTIEKDVFAFTQSGAGAASATPLAKKVAGQQGVDLAQVEGTGARGKVTKDDVLQKALAKTSGAAVSTSDEDVVIPFKGMRKVIAKRMSDSLKFHAQLTHTVKVDMTNATDLRNTYKQEDVKVSFNDIVMRATIKALTEFPMMNSISTEDSIIQKKHVNLGMAVALEDGLIVPNLKNAELLSLREIGAVAKDLAAKARENKLSPDEMAGGTFTVSNLGAYGLDHFTAIINQPESGILGVGGIEKVAVLIDEDEGEFEFKPIMKLTLTYDHRVMDGAPAAEFLMRVKKYIEHPSLML